MSEEQKPTIKKIQAIGLYRKVMADYFYELDKAMKEGSPKVGRGPVVVQQGGCPA